MTDKSIIRLKLITTSVLTSGIQFFVMTLGGASSLAIMQLKQMVREGRLSYVEEVQLGHPHHVRLENAMICQSIILVSGAWVLYLLGRTSFTQKFGYLIWLFFWTFLMATLPAVSD